MFAYCNKATWIFSCFWWFSCWSTFLGGYCYYRFSYAFSFDNISLKISDGEKIQLSVFREYFWFGGDGIFYLYKFGLLRIRWL